MNPWIIVGFLVALVAVGGVSYRAGNTNGHTAEKAVWEHRENVELATANTKLHDLEEAARATERLHTLQLANIGEGYEKDKANAEDQRKRDVAAARSGALKLRIPATACKDPGGSNVPGPVSPASERDGDKTTELPSEITGNLLSLADDADEVVKQLSACQAVVEADRKELEKRNVR